MAAVSGKSSIGCYNPLKYSRCSSKKWEIFLPFKIAGVGKKICIGNQMVSSAIWNK